MRSGQPLTGANRKRCREDEQLLQAVMEGSDKGYIIDTRSSQQAQQARMTGGGFESKSSYSHWKRLHRQMERCVCVCKKCLVGSGCCSPFYNNCSVRSNSLSLYVCAGVKRCRRV